MSVHKSYWHPKGASPLLSSQLPKEMKETNNAIVMTCFYCGVDGHKQMYCPKKKQDEERQSRCFACWKTGHKQFQCSFNRRRSITTGEEHSYSYSSLDMKFVNEFVFRTRTAPKCCKCDNVSTFEVWNSNDNATEQLCMECSERVEVDWNSIFNIDHNPIIVKN